MVLTLRFLSVLCVLVLALGLYQVAHAALSPTVSAMEVRDFTRITFNWPQKVRFKVKENDAGVTLTFSEPADINLQAIKQRLGPRLQGSSVSGDSRSITLNFDKPYRIRHFISGNANGIDIIGVKPQAEPQAEPQPEPQTPSPPEPQGNTQEAQGEAQQTRVSAYTPPASPPAPAAPEAEPAPIPVMAPTPKPTPPRQAAVEAPTPRQIAQADTSGETDSPTYSTKETNRPVDEAAQPVPDVANAPPQPITTQATDAEEPAPADAAQEAPADDPFAEFVGSTEPAVDTQTTRTGAPVPEVGVEETEASGSDRPFVITTKTTSTGIEIRFPWTKRTAAAVFFRDHYLWIVFDAKQNMNLTLLESILPASVTSIEEIPHATHTILRMQTDGSLYAQVGRPRGSVEWWVTLSPYQQVPTQLVSVELRPGARTPNIFLPVLQYAPPITVRDPSAGDRIVVTPFFKPGEGLYPGREFVELEILPSPQGLAVVKRSNQARVVPLRNGIRLTAQQTGLSLSADLPKLALEELQVLSSLTWFPYQQFKTPDNDIIALRRDIEQKLIDAQPLRANSLRLRLAQAHFAEGHAHETLGLLELIRASDPNFYDARRLAALEGAANFLINRHPEAIEAFASPALRDSQESKLWEQVLNVLQEERPRFDYLEQYDAFISKYPPRLREKLAILAADNYINRKSYNRALKTFDTLSVTGVDERVMPYVDFLLGKISAENEQYESAQNIWKPLTEQADNRFIRARAEFALTTLQYNLDEISAQEAIDRLDRLRIVWRGDSFELSLLQYLGELYVDNGDYLAGLRAWREVVNHFPDSAIASSVARDMAEAFNYLFAEGGADQLEPLQALATFYEFRELTPVGRAGDKMIQGLADRLASVDLLGRAAALLEHQIKFRQEGEARSAMGAQLALIYILNEQPARALDVLELTGYGENPAELDRKRTLLGAMALSETGRTQQALDMLASDVSREADALRLNIYWKERDWDQVINIAEGLLADRDNALAPLDEEETEQLLQLAIAYMFERDTIQLQYLRNYFGPLVSEGPNRDIFMYVTDASGPIDPYRFDQVNQQISRIESFMQTYRDRVARGGLSAVVN